MLTLTKQTNSYSSSFSFSHQSSVLFQLLELCALLKIIIIMIIIIIIIIIFITIRSTRCDDHQQPECFCLHHKQRKFEKVCVSNVKSTISTRLLIIICRSEECVIFKGQKVKRETLENKVGILWDNCPHPRTNVFLFLAINNYPEEVQNKYQIKNK